MLAAICRARGCRTNEREARPGKFEPYKHYIAERVKAAAPQWIPATVLLRELRALGYPGGYSILKDHLATLRPVVKPEPLIRFETEPGRQMQVDFATIRRGPIHRTAGQLRDFDLMEDLDLIRAERSCKVGSNGRTTKHES